MEPSRICEYWRGAVSTKAGTVEDQMPPLDARVQLTFMIFRERTERLEETEKVADVNCCHN